ncbi:UNVERIFIED_CONTAM: Structural maintenance of chromosomes protein 6B, partial [Sesamum calycinum]
MVRHALDAGYQSVASTRQERSRRTPHNSFRHARFFFSFESKPKAPKALKLRSFNGGSRVYPTPHVPNRLQAGIISRIRLENFMCHSNLEIELGDWVNFVTGQNGSGKSAILTALCVAFGSRARGTQRANAMKDFIKNGCRTTECSIPPENDMLLPHSEKRRRVGTRKEDLREIVEHFNIDVENPCVIMSQDKSREFLHSGNAKDKFKVQLLRKKLAWSWVYDADRKLDAQHKLIEKLKGRIPSCQARIDKQHVGRLGKPMQEVIALASRALCVAQDGRIGDKLSKKKSQISNMIERTSEVRRMKEDLKQNLSMAVKERLELESEQDRRTRQIQNMVQRVKLLEQQIHDLHEQYMKNTQAEENEMEEKLKKLQVEVDEVNANYQRLKEEEDEMAQRIAMLENEIVKITNQKMLREPIKIFLRVSVSSKCIKGTRLLHLEEVEWPISCRPLSAININLAAHQLAPLALM